MYIKPVSHIQHILDRIAPYGENLQVSRGEILRYQANNVRYCYLLSSGSITLNRRGDGMVLGSQQPPFILGVSNQLSGCENLYIRAMEPTQLFRLPLERFNLLVNKFDLWESFCHLLIYTASHVYERCTVAAKMSSYDIIKFQLQQLMLEPERTRSRMTAANFITDRTFLSRSGVMRILSHLRDAGYITLQRGILIDIHHLPERY